MTKKGEMDQAHNMSCQSRFGQSRPRPRNRTPPDSIDHLFRHQPQRGGTDPLRATHMQLTCLANVAPLSCTGRGSPEAKHLQDTLVVSSNSHVLVTQSKLHQTEALASRQTRANVRSFAMNVTCLISGRLPGVCCWEPQSGNLILSRSNQCTEQHKLCLALQLSWGSLGLNATEDGPGRQPTTVTTPWSPGSGSRKKKTHDVASRGTTLQVPSPRVQVVWHLPSTLPNWVAPRNSTDPSHWLHPGARPSILQAPLPIV